ncbi:MAG: SPFH/Band 7/PHB domain protein [Cyanothece sp. SIO1E1]|nr:SPFH/Band 7/PHB domain protein [Cyanothece sp. SIO1E1]
MSQILAALALVIVGYTIGSVKIVNQGDEALIERLGRYHKKLGPGLNFIVPFLDTVVLEETVRERVLDVDPQAAITKDNVSLMVDAVVFWRILDLERAFYAVEEIETAITNLVLTTLRSEIGQMAFERTFSSRAQVNRALLDHLDEATAPWGVKITRVEIQDIQPPEEVLKSMQQQQAAEIKRRATVSEAEGERQAAIARAEGTVKSMELLSGAMKSPADMRPILQFLVAQQYVEANQKLGESPNSKIVFMDPKALSEAMTDLIEQLPEPPSDAAGNGKT